MQVVLVMFRADGQRRSFSIVRDMTVIGRREDCDLRIPLGEVSRKHCRLIKDEQGVRVEDLGSSNGTFHNNERVQEAPLAPGDTIRVGPVTFMVQIDGVPSDEEMQPAALPEAEPVSSSANEAESTAHPAQAAHGAADSEDLSVFLSDDSATGDSHQTDRSHGTDHPDSAELELLEEHTTPQDNPS
jgi:pSer/pThr/pTyr-binding forkhead associated (FHA) protein